MSPRVRARRMSRRCSGVRRCRSDDRGPGPARGRLLQGSRAGHPCVDPLVRGRRGGQPLHHVRDLAAQVDHPAVPVGAETVEHLLEAAPPKHAVEPAEQHRQPQQLFVQRTQPVADSEQARRVDDEGRHRHSLRGRSGAVEVAQGAMLAVPWRGADASRARQSRRRGSGRRPTAGPGRRDGGGSTRGPAQTVPGAPAGSCSTGASAMLDLALAEIGLYEGARITPADGVPPAATAPAAAARAASDRRLRRRPIAAATARRSARRPRS